jgi:hypothetical protein
MAVLTAERSYKTRAGGTHRFDTYPLAAAVTIWNGALVAFDAAGNIVPAATTAGITVCGVAQSTVVNATGAAGDKRVLVMTGCRVNFVSATAGAAITRAHYGRLVYALDDQTITNAAGIVAGVCDLIDADGVWVFVDMAINAAAQAAIAA